MTMTPGSAHDAVAGLTLAEQALLAAELGGALADPASATDTALAVPFPTQMGPFCGHAPRDTALAGPAITLMFGPVCGRAPSDSTRAV
ncbi:hypothetical protein FHS89_001392 [Rubricella aquisinus]|uniref:Uncharacterized protein n=1 Tax=Rubricella aquisinus TaxID=2028108 RepID=A0A840WW20_9RHOB|nr:hypothetical protein [Rubricella aquisinus]MBB5515380.1 hypothetical protein [Rubricella aquisinus]